MPMSGVYENVFYTPEISILLSLRGELLITICVRIPCSGIPFARFYCTKVYFTVFNYIKEKL